MWRYLGQVSQVVEEEGGKKGEKHNERIMHVTVS